MYTKRRCGNLIKLACILGILAVFGITFASAMRLVTFSRVEVYPANVSTTLESDYDISGLGLGDTIVNGATFKPNGEGDEMYVRADFRYYKDSTLSDEDKRFLLAINYDGFDTYSSSSYMWTRGEDGRYYLTDSNAKPIKVLNVNTEYIFNGNLTYNGAMCILNDTAKPNGLRLSTKFEAVYTNASVSQISDITPYFANYYGDNPTLGYVVAFDTGVANPISAQTFLSNGQKVTTPATPVKEGYEFEGWFTDENCTITYDFDNTIVSKNFLLYAKMVEVCTLTVNADDNVSAVALTSSSGSAITNGRVVKGTTITINATFNTGYEMNVITVNGATFTNGGTYTVNNNTVINVTSKLKQYHLYYSGSNCTVNVTNNGKLLSSGSTISHFDVLTISASKLNEDCVPVVLKVNNTTFTSGQTHTVSGLVTVSAVSYLKPQGTLSSSYLTTFGVTDKSTVSTINFYDTLSSVPSSVSSTTEYDLTESTDTVKVRGYKVANSSNSSLYDLHIASRKTVRLPQNSGSLFAMFLYNESDKTYTSNLTAINGLTLVDTSQVTDMNRMFNRCTKLTSLDVSGFDTSKVTNMTTMFQFCSGLTSLNLSNFNTSNVTNMSYMFSTCTGLTSVNVSSFDTSKVTSMSRMFAVCSALTSLNVSGFDTSKVTDFRMMFTNCSGLTSINISNFNTSSATDMGYMFSGCSGVTSLDLSKFNTLKVTDMSYMFSGCSGLTSVNVSSFDTSSVTSLHSMFNNCCKLTSLDITNFNTSKVTNMCNVFYNCSSLSSLDVSNFNTSRVTDMGWMFSNCQGLTSLDLSNFNTSKVTSMSAMFQMCTGLTSISLNSFNTSSLEDTVMLFNACSNLKTIDISSFNTSSVTNMIAMFQTCYNLTTIYVGLYWNTGNVTSSASMFYGCSKLRNFSSSYLDKTRAHTGSDGYLTINGLSSSYVSTLGVDKTKVKTITFYDANETITGATSSANVSLSGSNYIVGYVKTNASDSTMYDLHIVGKLGLPLYTGSSLFSGFTNLTNIYGPNKVNTSNVTNMYYMFYNCNSLTSLDVSNFDISSVTNMYRMFYNCSKLTSIDLSSFDTSSVTSMGAMFYNCSSLTSLDVSKFNTSKVTDISYMFGSCSSLTSLDLSSFNTSSVTSIVSMFSSCSKLTSLNLSNFDTSSVTDMRFMFHGCSSLTRLDLSNFNTSRVTDMGWMFFNCSKLTSLDLSSFNTSNVTNMYSMFYNCSGLTVIYVGIGWSTSAVTSSSSMFYSCTKLRNFNSSYEDKTRANTSNTGYLSYSSSGYTYLEYIQGYGGQYIITDVTVNSDIQTFEVDMQIKFTDLSTRQLMGYSGNNGGYFGVNNGVYTLQYGVSLGLAPSLTSYDHLVYKKTSTLDILTVNDTTAQSSRDTTSGVFNLFDLVNGDWKNKMCMKKCKMYVNGVLVRDYIPAVRNSDASVGLYDRANKVFYENKGCGSFGSDILDLSAYTQVNYLQSSGTQYINTGFKANQDTSIEVKGSTTTGTSTYGGTPAYLNVTATSSGTYFYWNGYNTGLKGNAVDGSTVHIYKQVKNNAYRNGSLVGTWTYTTWQDSYYMFLFGRNSNGSLNDAGTTKIYYCRMWDNGVIIRYFIPVKRSSDSVYGMYDIVNKVFYTNGGSGTFTSG